MNSKYHTYKSHIKPMLDFIDNELHLHSKEKIKILKLAAIFHDCIYIAGSCTNEDDSINLFKDFYNNNYKSNLEIIEKSMHYLKDVPINDGEYNKVIELIENTKNPFDMRYGDELGHIFAKLDIHVLTQDFYSLMIYEHRIYNEFKNIYTLSEYKSERVDFLKKIVDKMPCVNTNGINQLISYVENRNYGTLGIFVGSFNPFHTGHYNVLEQARKDFDSIIIVQMQDFAKPKSIYEMPNLEEKVIKSDKTLVQIFNELKEGFNDATIIRALRNGDDLQHEQNLKQTVHDFDENIRFIYYLADSKFSHISSSMIRTLPEGLRDRYLY